MPDDCMVGGCFRREYRPARLLKAGITVVCQYNKLFGGCGAFKWTAIIVALILNLPRTGTAQCGSVGDPIVHITFGTTDNPDFGGGTTTYQHRSSGGLNDGEYRLGNMASDGRSEWHRLYDHTSGNGEGAMLIVNASYDAGEFYRIRVSGLCQRTRFRFSAWIANANQPSNCERLVLPNVRFVIEDTLGNVVSDPYTTGSIPATEMSTWREYGFEFDTEDETDFDLVLINDNPGGCGNDLVIDDIQFRPCGPAITLASLTGIWQADTLFYCSAPGPMSLIGTLVDNGIYDGTPVFQWQIRTAGNTEWQDIPSERNEVLNFTPVRGSWYRLTAAATTANLANPLCRIASPAVRIAEVAPLAAMSETIQLDAFCPGEIRWLRPPGYPSRHDAGPIAYQWQIFRDGQLVATADSAAYRFEPDSPGDYRIDRWAVNGCGDRVLTHTYISTVPKTFLSSLTVPRLTYCPEDDPVALIGTVINGGDTVSGTYDGPGVSGNYFDPAVAGVGTHVITFTPTGVLCYEPSEVSVTVLDSVFVRPMETIRIRAGQRTVLRPETNGTRFRWSNEPGLDNYSSPSPVAAPKETTTYLLTVSNDTGCAKTIPVTVIVLPDLVIPDGFTPNGDGVNDTWRIEGLDAYTNVRIQLFNRWGSRVFTSNGYSTPWNGTFNGSALPEGVYYYVLTADLLDRPITGSVVILH